MEKQVIQTDKAPSAIGPYSQAVKYDNMMFISGQIPLSETGDIPADIKEQTNNCMKNVGGILESENLTYSDILKCTIFTTRMEDYPLINEEYAKYFPEDPPARAVVGVAALPKNADVEIEAIVKLK